MVTYRRCTLAILGMVCTMIIGCSTKAAYMRGWQPSEGITNRWEKGTFRTAKLSPDEAAVVDELGIPDVIRFFRQVETRERVYEWIYAEEAQEGPIVWFLDGERVDYVTVDTNTSPLTRAERETLKRKAITGGVLAGIVGGAATSLLIFAPQLGLED